MRCYWLAEEDQESPDFGSTCYMPAALCTSAAGPSLGEREDVRGVSGEDRNVRKCLSQPPCRVLSQERSGLVAPNSFCPPQCSSWLLEYHIVFHVFVTRLTLPLLLEFGDRLFLLENSDQILCLSLCWGSSPPTESLATLSVLLP